MAITQRIISFLALTACLLAAHASAEAQTDIRDYGAVCNWTDQHLAVEAALAAGHTRILLPIGCGWAPTLVPAGVSVVGAHPWGSFLTGARDPDGCVTLGPGASLANVAVYSACGSNTGPVAFYANWTTVNMPVAIQGNRGLQIDVGEGNKDLSGVTVNGFAGTGDNFYSQVVGGHARTTFRGDMAVSSQPGVSANIGLYLTQFHGVYSEPMFAIDAEDAMGHPTDPGVFTGDFLLFRKRRVEQFRVTHEGDLVVRGTRGYTGCLSGLRIVGGIIVGPCQ